MCRSSGLQDWQASRLKTARKLGAEDDRSNSSTLLRFTWNNKLEVVYGKSAAIEDGRILSFKPYATWIPAGIQILDGRMSSPNT